MKKVYLNRMFATLPLVILPFLFSNQLIAQQKVQFTQYMFNGLVINPAYAGSDEALSLTFVQRRQWAGVENAPTTQTLSAHTLFREKHTGVGLTIINDKIGIHRNLSVLTNYAYHIRVGERSFLSMGILAGIHNRKSDYASLMASDPKLYNPYISHTAFDFGTGIYFRSKRFHAGLSAPGLIPEKVNINDTLSLRLGGVHYLLFSRYRIPLTDKLEVEPGILFKYLDGVPLSYDLYTNMIFREVLTAGLSYRKKESVDFLIKCQLTPQLQFGYSYDHPVGELSRLSNGSHEIMIQYLFRYVRTNVTSPR